MRKAESSRATPGAIVLAVVRACLVFFGTTLVAHTLAVGTTRGRFRPLDQQDFTVDLTGAGLPSYPSWLWDALSIDQELLGPLANTVWLALVSMLFGVLLGFAISGLLRIRSLRRFVGGLHGPLLALAVPGVLLLPVYRWADSQQLLPERPSATDQAASSSFWFLAFWGAFVGLALAVGLTGQLTTDQRHRSAGTEIAANTGASLPFRFGKRDLGAPTTVLLLGLASVELISGHNGLFRYMANRLGDGDLAGALSVVAVVALVGAAVTLAIDVLRATDSRADHTYPDHPSRLSDATWPLLAALAVLAMVAIVGYLRDPILVAGQNQPLSTPTFGGPWLGTDSAGISFVERLVIALGPTMVSAVVPGLLAGLLGGAIHWVTRRTPTPARHAITTVIDVTWWPLPLVLPLAHLNTGNPERSEFDLTVTLVTGIALTPLAVRVLHRSAKRGQFGMQPLLSVAVFLMAIAGSARIFLGFFGVTNSPHGPANADLGALVASGSSDLGEVWSVTPPALAGVGVLSLLYWLAGAISTPVPHRELAPATAATPQPIDLASTETPSPGESTTRVGPLGPEDLRLVVRQQREGMLSASEGQLDAEIPIEAAESDDAEEEIDLRVGPPVAEPVQRRPIVNLAERTAASQEPSPVERSEDDITVAVTPATATDSRVTNDRISESRASGEGSSIDDLPDDDLDEQTKAELDLLNANSTDLAADASKTIELRPSTLRRAGIVAPGTAPSPKRANTRPILAAQAEEYDGEPAADGPTDSSATEASPATTDSQADPQSQD